MLGLPSCRDVAEQLSEDLDKPITGWRWLKLKVHLLMCAYCQRYGTQIKLTSKTLQQMDSARTPSAELEESAVQIYRSHLKSECQSSSKAE